MAHIAVAQIIAPHRLDIDRPVREAECLMPLLTGSEAGRCAPEHTGGGCAVQPAGRAGCGQTIRARRAPACMIERTISHHASELVLLIETRGCQCRWIEDQPDAEGLCCGALTDGGSLVTAAECLIGAVVNG